MKSWNSSHHTSRGQSLGKINPMVRDIPRVQSVT